MLADLNVTRGEFIPDLRPATGFEAFPLEQLEMLRDVTVVIYPKQPNGTDSAGMKSVFGQPAVEPHSGSSFGPGIRNQHSGHRLRHCQSIGLNELETGALEALS